MLRTFLFWNLFWFLLSTLRLNFVISRSSKLNKKCAKNNSAFSLVRNHLTETPPVDLSIVQCLRTLTPPTWFSPHHYQLRTLPRLFFDLEKRIQRKFIYSLNFQPITLKFLSICDLECQKADLDFWSERAVNNLKFRFILRNKKKILAEFWT